MKKALFIDRDGTILIEPPVDYQIDSLDKFQFVPGAISGLKVLAGLGFELVMASNQDGLGTESFPTEDFLPLQNLMLDILRSEGVVFNDIIIDTTFPEEKAPTRKPGTALFGKYVNGDYNLAESYVIGDRDTDAQLAENLGCRFLRIGENSWEQIAEKLSLEERSAFVSRNTRETQVSVRVTLDDSQPSQIDTGLKFFDHMLAQIATHGNIRLDISAKGDLEVDEHHTMEDVAITLGTALLQALGNKRGIGRYGFALPMDESEALVLIDFGGRIDFEWDVTFTREYVGDTPTEMFRHVFQSLASAMQCNLHISAKGENNHHLAEAIFKAFARALKAAVHRQPFDYSLPSSKGIL